LQDRQSFSLTPEVANFDKQSQILEGISRLFAEIGESTSPASGPLRSGALGLGFARGITTYRSGLDGLSE